MPHLFVFKNIGAYFAILIRHNNLWEFMKKILAFALILLLHKTVNSQRLSIDVLPGLMNYSGDLQPSALTFKESLPAIQAGLSYKLTNNLYIRGAYLAGQVQADDKLNTGKNKRRNLNFKSVILAGSFTIEYDVFKFRVNKQWTPYVFAGVGYFYFNPNTHDTAGNKYYLRPLGTEGQGLPQYPGRKVYSIYQFNIPAGIGMKYAVNDKIAIGFEFCMRQLFTDYLDDVSTTYPNQLALLNARGPKAVELSFRQGEIDPRVTYRNGAIRGNPGSKDYYYTGLARITYTLGDGSGGNSNSGGSTRFLKCTKPKL